LTVLVTGFPGFIGGRLVEALLAESTDSRVVALVEARMTDKARELAQRLGAGAPEGSDGARIEVLPGDITERRLGLDDERYERLAAETTAVYHLAAVYDLAVPLEIATRVNVDGTGNVLTFCRDCERLDRLHYVSTAYVAGQRTGHVYEHELALGQRFKNNYESTKFQAEVWVREAMDKVPTTIYRPAIVVGDSKTGETAKFDGPYYMLRVISRAVRWHMPIPRFGRAEAPFNVVPVDFIIDALTTADDVPELVGSTLHLVDPEPVAGGEVFDILAKEYAGRATAYRLPPRLVAGALRVPAVRQLFSGAPPQSIRYLNHPFYFDTRAARELFEPAGVRCPRIEEYVGPLVEFFREHEDDPSYAPG
jgi:thioester reductase-like protein